jgi:TRAP-type C4-dicarboxylate transport system substrate-binding protein
VRMFSKRPIRTLDDLQQAKLVTSQSDGRIVRWYRSNGFNPVALSDAQVVPQLKLPNGMIDAVPLPPYAAMVMQVHAAAPYMLDLSFAPLVGATVITESAWSKLSPRDRATMQAAARAMQERVFTEVPRLDTRSVASMRRVKLTVTTLDPVAAAEFRAAADRMVPALRGNTVPADIYDLAVKARDEYRQSRSRTGS